MPMGFVADSGLGFSDDDDSSSASLLRSSVSMLGLGEESSMSLDGEDFFFPLKSCFKRLTEDEAEERVAIESESFFFFLEGMGFAGIQFFRFCHTPCLASLSVMSFFVEMGVVLEALLLLYGQIGVVSERKDLPLLALVVLFWL